MGQPGTRALERSLAAIDELDGTPWGNLVVARRDRSARDEARLADGPLTGLIGVVKDNIDLADLPTRCGSDASSASPAIEDAAVVRAVRAAGAVIAGKAHMHEWGAGVSGLVSRDGPARHPIDSARITGGSSSGPAALVARGVVDFALATDTGASIRTPAALCGCVGLVPRQDAMSRDGVQRLNPTLDRVGILARDVSTARAIWGVFSSTAPVAPRSLRIGVIDTDATTPVNLGIEAAVRVLSRDHDVRSVTFDGAERLRSIYRVVSAYEVADLVSGLGARAALLQPELRAVLAATTFPDETAYREALAALEVARATEAALLGVDVLLLPTVPVTSPRAVDVDLRMRARLMDACTPFSVLDWPALSVPAAVAGLPVGVQLVGVAVGESELLDLGSQIS